MKMPSIGLCLSLLFAAGTALAQTPAQNVNIRGVVTGFDGKTISVNSRDAGAVQVALPETVNISGTKAFSMADIQPGMVLGVTTVRRADNETVAIDVRPIPPTAPLGLSAFDLAPGATMTAPNAGYRAGHLAFGASGRR